MDRIFGRGNSSSGRGGSGSSSSLAALVALGLGFFGALVNQVAGSGSNSSSALTANNTSNASIISVPQFNQMEEVKTVLLLCLLLSALVLFICGSRRVAVYWLTRPPRGFSNHTLMMEGASFQGDYITVRGTEDSNDPSSESQSSRSSRSSSISSTTILVESVVSEGISDCDDIRKELDAIWEKNRRT